MIAAGLGQQERSIRGDMIVRKLLAALAALLALASPAGAAWYEATTPHFIIRAEGDEAKVRDFAARLERFDRALRFVYKREDEPWRRSTVSPCTRCLQALSAPSAAAVRPKSPASTSRAPASR